MNKKYCFGSTIFTIIADRPFLFALEIDRIDDDIPDSMSYIIHYIMNYI